MSDEKRGGSRLPVQARPARDLDTYAAMSGPGSDPASGSNLLAAIWRRRAVVLACVILGLVVGVVYLIRADRVYSSASTVLVQQQTASIFRDDVGSTYGSAGYLQTECQLIQSTPILRRAVDVPGVSETELLRGLESDVAAAKLHQYVLATPAKLGDYLIISSETPDPQDAATVVNAVVQAYIDYQAEQHQNSAVEVAKIVQKNIDSHKLELKEAQEKMLAMRRANPQLGLMGDKGSMAVQRLIELSNELAMVRTKSDELKAAVAAVDATDPHDLSALRSVVDQYQLTAQLPPSNLPMLTAMYADAVNRMQTADDAQWGMGNPLRQRAQLSLDRAKNDLGNATQQAALSCVKTVHDASALADARVRHTEKVMADEQSVTTGLNVQEAEYEQCAQQAARSDRAMDALNDQLKRLQSLEDKSPTTITRLEVAKMNPVAVSPKASKSLGLGLVGGLLAGMGAALAFDKMDQRLRSVEEIGTLLDATILGVVPRIVRRILPGESGREIELKPRSGVAEAFRTVRTAIYFGGPATAADRVGRTILVTSPTPGDGKSTCISNLAIAVAQGGRRTLLIDADCRRPVQHKTFRLADGHGLTSVLTGAATLDEAVRPTHIERLDVLPCGPLPHNPAELLDSQALLDLLGETARRYDQVLIDSPPVTLVSDARVLAASCDAAILVLRHDRSTRRGAQLAWNALSSVGANLLGVIVNDLARQKDGHGYNYYGYGRYGYAPAAKAELPHAGANGSAVNGNGQTVVVATVD